MSIDGDDGRSREQLPPGWSGAYPAQQPAYGQPVYGQPAYGQPGYGGQPYGQPGHGVGGYGPPPYPGAPPARPGTVITAAVLGLVLGSLGLLATVGLLAGGALVDDLATAAGGADPDEVNGVQAGLLVVAVLALAWTVVMVWGAVLALRGRSRVLLIVGASISVPITGLVLLGGLVAALDQPTGAAGTLLVLLALFLVAVATLVLLCLRSANQFFAAHRQHRALRPR